MDLQKALHSCGYMARPEELAGLRAMLAAGWRPIQAALLEGPPGCGKSSLPQVLASAIGAELLFYQMHSWSDDQELLAGINIPAVVSGDANSVVRPGILWTAASQSQKSRTILVLDEVDKVQDRIEYLLLDFLESGRVQTSPGRCEQVGELLVFLTSNGTRELSQPLLRRCRRIRMRPVPGNVMDGIVRRLLPEVPAGVITTLRQAGVALAEADGAVFSVKELHALVRDVWYTANSHKDVVLLASQWAVYGPRGCGLLESTANMLAPAWGEVLAARRRGGRK